MALYFVADIHLDNDEPAITAGFVDFLTQIAADAEALYILGDLFERWIGDDEPSALHDRIATALQALRQQGVACYFIHGNRDFLLGQNYARRCGMTLLPEQVLLERYGQRILLMHGDQLCTGDASYQAFRRKVQQRWLQRLFLALPLRWRLAIAARMRARSQQANSAKSVTIMDVEPQTVNAVIEAAEADILIHGHTHRPAIHTVEIEGQLRQRAVLGAWHHEGSALRLSGSGLELRRIPYSATP